MRQQLPGSQSSFSSESAAENFVQGGGGAGKGQGCSVPRQGGLGANCSEQ